MHQDKPSYEELRDALHGATQSLRAEAEALQDSHTRPDGTFHTEEEQAEVDEAFAEVDRYAALLLRAGQPLDGPDPTPRTREDGGRGDPHTLNPPADT